MIHAYTRVTVRPCTRRKIDTELVLGLALSCYVVLSWVGPVNADEKGETLELDARSRAGGYVTQETLKWQARETAIIICDMWDEHWCEGATRRVREMAPTMNEVVEKAREKGVLIVHAPSGTLGAYAKTRERSLSERAVSPTPLPTEINEWCRLIPDKEGDLPIDDSDGGCDCEPSCKQRRAWSRQIDTIGIRNGDAISDSGAEVWSLFESRGITNVILMGVHTNMCVLGRSFGVRNMVRFGKNVVLMRDMTDTMYSSRSRPFVSHFRGTDLVVKHIESNWCPTITSSAFTGRDSFRFQNDERSHVVFLIGEREYETKATLPVFARDVLEADLGLRTTILHADPENRNRVPGIEAVRKADLLFLSMRRRALPTADMQLVREYLKSGKPLVGIRTANHAFHMRGKNPAGYDEWVEFDAEVIGGHYTGHHGKGPPNTITVSPGADRHPILRGVHSLPFSSDESLYQNAPLSSKATPILVGSIRGQPTEPVAWTHRYGNARVFYVALGGPGDFQKRAFVTLLSNAVLWALGEEIPVVAGDHRAHASR